MVKIARYIAFIIITGLALLLAMDELFYGEPVHDPNLTFWLLLIAVVTVGLGFIALYRAYHSISSLNQTVLRLSQNDFSEPPPANPAFLLRPLCSSIQVLTERMKESQSIRALEIERLQNQFNQELKKTTERVSQLEEENRRLGAISQELGQAYARLNRDLSQLEEVQRLLLPPPRFCHENLSIHALYIPNGQTGGDYYDFILSPDGKCAYIAIADVSGHGSPAAFIMGITRALLHSEIEHHSSPADILNSLNRFLMKSIRSNEFVTMFLGRLNREDNSFIFSNAGHMPPIRFHASSEEMIELEESRGVPLGVLEAPNYEETQTSLTPGDRIFMFTDGVVELFNKQRVAYGESRLLKTIQDNRSLQTEDLLDTVAKDVEMFLERDLDVEPLEDDFTLVVFSTSPNA